MSRHLAGTGAQMLVAQSSTSSFQDSWAPAQHASLAALRAAETWRPMVHATLTGISAVYDAERSAGRAPAEHRQQHRAGLRGAAGDGREPLRPAAATG